MNQIIFYILLGLAAGIASGIFGIGGGLIMVPALVLLFGMTQHMAQGTSLAVMIPPIGILAAWKYHQTGNLKISVALWIASGFIVGALLGATFIQPVSDIMLKRAFGIVMALVALKMIWGK